MKLSKTNNKGFTMMELLGVIAIILILVAIVLPLIDGAREGARVAAMDRQLQTLNSALSNYQAAGGSIDDLYATQKNAFQEDLAHYPWDTADLVLARLKGTHQIGGSIVGPFLTENVERAMRKGGRFYRLFFHAPPPPTLPVHLQTPAALTAKFTFGSPAFVNDPSQKEDVLNPNTPN